MCVPRKEQLPPAPAPSAPPMSSDFQQTAHRFKESVQKTVAGVDTRVVSYSFSKGLGLGAGFEMGRAGGNAVVKSMKC
jgi:hypothetical protein